MRLTNITISNVLGVESAEIRPTRPAVLIAGKNGAGKSSIREAIRQAFTGTPGRAVEHKKDYGQLIHNGAEFGSVTVEFDGGAATIVLPKGDRNIEGKIEGDGSIAFCVDTEQFAKLDDKTRRAMLFALTGVRVTPATVKDRLTARGVDMARAERALPLLAAGFDSAHSEAKAKAREAKASWKTTTGGETWGKDKAGKWEPKALDMPAEKACKLLENAKGEAANLDAEIADVQRQIGEAQAAVAQQRTVASKRDELTAKASTAERFRAKLERDRAELAEWQHKVAETKAKAGKAPNPRAPGEFLLRGLASVTQDFLALTCEFSEVEWPSELVTRASVSLAEYRKLHGEPVDEKTEYDPEAAAKLPEYERALNLMESSVANAERDMLAAEQAAAALKEIGDPEQVGIDIDALKARANDLAEKRRAWRDDADKYRQIVEEAKRREGVKQKADELHADVLAWEEIAQAFAPDGIQAEFLADAIRPFNAMLSELSDLAQWPLVTLDNDMQIIVGGWAYEFRSESEKWRADSIIAAAIAKVSGLRFVMLDRFDVLDMQGRGEALFWIDDMIADGHIESAIILGTLKALPAGLPDNICSAWIESGRVAAEAA